MGVALVTVAVFGVGVVVALGNIVVFRAGGNCRRVIVLVRIVSVRSGVRGVVGGG